VGRFNELITCIKRKVNVDESFEKILPYFDSYINLKSYQWSKNPEFTRMFSIDDLRNIFLYKTFKLAESFNYDDSKDEKENLRIFGGLLKKSITNASIDLNYRETRPKRFASNNIQPLKNEVVVNDEEEFVFIVNDGDDLQYKFLIEAIMRKLSPNAQKCFELKIKGHKNRPISLLTGLKESTIASIMTKEIFPAVEDELGKNIPRNC